MHRKDVHRGGRQRRRVAAAGATTTGLRTPCSCFVAKWYDAKDAIEISPTQALYAQNRGAALFGLLLFWPCCPSSLLRTHTKPTSTTRPPPPISTAPTQYNRVVHGIRECAGKHVIFSFVTPVLMLTRACDASADSISAIRLNETFCCLSCCMRRCVFVPAETCASFWMSDGFGMSAVPADG